MRCVHVLRDHRAAVSPKSYNYATQSIAMSVYVVKDRVVHAATA